MAYPNASPVRQLLDHLHLYSLLQHEYGASGIEPLWTKAEHALRAILDEMKSLPPDAVLSQQQPDDLAGIRRLRSPGPRRIRHQLDIPRYRDKLEGALFGRIAGNLLGAPVEGTPIGFMENLARENNDPFPPVDYWAYVPQPFELHNHFSPRQAYTRTHMNGVPVDDDLTYTLLGLLIIETYGPDFTTEQVAQAWLDYLPFAYTAEEAVLRNLKAGVPAAQAAVTDNPFMEWIGADIRADPWGYLAPGHPELAADMAYRDAYLSHRRNGIYGAMMFAAAIAAAFEVQDPLEAIRIGLTEIPQDCVLAQHARWALEEAPRMTSFRQAREAVDQRFDGMSGAHTINNACLTILGLAVGGTDLTRVIGETVAMGLDNDCTAATAGSIVGAIVGKRGIPAHWYQHFDDRIATYMIGKPQMALSDVIDRFVEQTIRVHARHMSTTG